MVKLNDGNWIHFFINLVQYPLFNFEPIKLQEVHSSIFGLDFPDLEQFQFLAHFYILQDFMDVSIIFLDLTHHVRFYLIQNGHSITLQYFFAKHWYFPLNFFFPDPQSVLLFPQGILVLSVVILSGIWDSLISFTLGCGVTILF